MRKRADQSTYDPSAAALVAELVALHGHLVGGPSLHKLLGFRSASSFYRSMKAGLLGVTVFQLPGRKGWFSLTGEVAHWLARQRAGVAGGATGLPAKTGKGKAQR